MDRNMDFFMNAEKEERQEVEIQGIEKFKYPKGHEKEGQVIPWVLKPITTPELDRLTEQNTTKKRKKGRVIKNLDEKRLTNEMMIETIVYPDFKNQAWLDKEKLVDPVDLMLKVLDLPGDYARISQTVCEVNGIDEDEEELIKEAKN